MRSKCPDISCIIPAYNESDSLLTTLPLLCDTLTPLAQKLEIIVVDDGSHDMTSATVVALRKDYPIKLIQLSRNFGKEYAITAGLDQAKGDVAIIVDADGQHPVSLIADFLNHWQSGYDMVYGIRKHRKDEFFLKRKLTAFFYTLINYKSEIKITPNAGDFRLLDRRVIEAIKTLPERARFMKGLYAWVGFKSKSVFYEPQIRQQGHSHFNLRRYSELALTGLTSFTDLPLRICGILGGLISMCSIFYGLYIALHTLLVGATLPGWATLAVAITFLGGLQLLSIGILGEYISRIFVEVKGRPNYVVAKQVGFDD
jgi:polyisoprenyl-phosphate glycosyltransferase